MKKGQIINGIGLAIADILILIGILVFFIERITTIANYSNRAYQEVMLENIHLLTQSEPFLLTDFYCRDIDFKSLDGKYNKAMVLYTSPNDSIAKVGIEINKKHMFKKEVEEYGKILVEANGGMWQLPTYQGNKLFGYQYMNDKEIENFKKQIGEDKFSGGIMLKHVPTETLSDNWIEIVGFSILIILLLISILSHFKK